VIGTLTPESDGKRLVFTTEEVDKIHTLFWTMNLNRRDFAVETKQAMYQDRAELRDEEMARQKVTDAENLPQVEFKAVKRIKQKLDN